MNEVLNKHQMLVTLERVNQILDSLCIQGVDSAVRLKAAHDAITVLYQSLNQSMVGRQLRAGEPQVNGAPPVAPPAPEETEHVI